jgi:hypothetical protein
MKKYRLKIEYDENGNKSFYPQNKGLFFWRYYTKQVCDTLLTVNFRNEQNAINFIKKMERRNSVEYKEVNFD